MTDGLSRRLLLRNKAGRIVAHAIIDPEDYERIGRHRWYRHKTGYAARRAKRTDPTPGTTLYLQREVLRVGRNEPRVADHVNQQVLDCRRSNLRLIPREENGWANIQRHGPRTTTDG